MHANGQPAYARLLPRPQVVGRAIAGIGLQRDLERLSLGAESRRDAADDAVQVLGRPVGVGQDPLVVLGHGYHQRAFGGDPSVVGRTIYLNRHPYTVIGVVSPEFKGMFRGIEKETPTVGFPTVFITHKDVDAELVYLVTKTIGDNKAALVAAHKGLAKFDPASAWRPELVGLPLHPGAEKYYREKGWMK